MTNSPEDENTYEIHRNDDTGKSDAELPAYGDLDTGLEEITPTQETPQPVPTEEDIDRYIDNQEDITEDKRHPHYKQ